MLDCQDRRINNVGGKLINNFYIYLDIEASKELFLMHNTSRNGQVSEVREIPRSEFITPGTFWQISTGNFMNH